MKSIITTSFLLVITLSLNAQSLGAERVSHIKNSTVRVIINGQPIGTAFIVDEKGDMISCFHVIELALKLKVKTEVEFITGERVEVNLYNYFLEEGLREAVGYDCILLIPAKRSTTQFEFIKVGKFADVEEGDQIYTIGFPLAIKQHVISAGILSTKWVQSNIFTYMGHPDSIKRNVAWLDITMNRGNSGGPVIKIGNIPSDDEVIGISTFILNPYGLVAEQLASSISQSNFDIQFGGISQNKVTQLFAEAIANNSIGVSGCISIDHLLSIVNRMTGKSQ